MGPGSSFLYAPYSANGNAEFPRERGLGSHAGHDFIDISFSEHGSAVSFAARASVALIHLATVLLAVTTSKMRGIHAFPIVAGMQNQAARWYGAFVEFIAKSVRSDRGLFGFGIKQSISVIVKRRSPFPASFIAVFIDLLPETYFRWNGNRTEHNQTSSIDCTIYSTLASYCNSNEAVI